MTTNRNRPSQRHLLRRSLAEGEKGKGGKGTRKNKRMSKQKKYLQPLKRLLRITRHAASVQLFDAIWHVVFHMMEHAWKEHEAKRYLQDTYFLEATVQSVQKLFKGASRGSWQRDNMWIAGHWGGVLGTAPGTSSGTTTLEARHSQWEEEVKAGVGNSVMKVLPQMQAMYTDKWNDIFRWGAPCSFDHLPAE